MEGGFEEQEFEVLKINPDYPYLTFIPINPEFRKLFIAFNATLTCLSIHLVPRG